MLFRFAGRAPRAPRGCRPARVAGGVLRRVRRRYARPRHAPHADVIAALAEDRIVSQEVALPRIEESRGITQAYWDRPHRSNWTEWDTQDETELSRTEVDRSLFEWDPLRRAMLRFLQDFDAVICPVAERSAGPHNSVDAQSYIYTLPFSLTGWPVAVIRAGPASDGMPIGVQVASGPWRDDVALAVAGRVETLLGGWHREPNLLSPPRSASGRAIFARHNGIDYHFHSPK